MPSVFHAVYGVCRRDGGTKKTCYREAVEVLQSDYGVVVKRRRLKPKRKVKRRR